MLVLSTRPPKEALKEWASFAEIDDDPHVATRRAIVRAAAEIGKEKL